MWFNLTSNTFPEPTQVVSDTQAVFIGGGNTFRLLKAFYDFDLIERLRQRVGEGTHLLVENGSTTLKGSAGARIFRKGLEPVEVQPSAQFNDLLGRL